MSLCATQFLTKMDLNSTTTLATPYLETDDTFLLQYIGLRVVFIVSIAVLIVATIFGNTLTLVAIIQCKALRTASNILVVSLAVSDMMVAVGVMPLSLVKTIFPNRIITHPFCDVWVSLDVLCCTASILNLCVISLDRYWSIKCPFTYKKKQTMGHMLVMASVVWALSTVISVAPLLGWKTQEEKNEPTCHVSQDKFYTIFSTFGAFFIPMTIMLALYWLIYLEARGRIRGTSFNKYGKNVVPVLRKEAVLKGSKADDLSSATTCTDLSGEQNRENLSQSSVLLVNGKREISLSNTDLNKMSKNFKSKHGGSTLSLPASSKQGCLSPQLRRFQAEKQAIANRREHRAAKTLAIVTGVFLVCWLPFFCLALLMPFFIDWDIPQWFSSLLLWLGYFNSMLNPIIYTKFNPEFNKAFRKTLRCSNTVR